jgi:hypothetical protein
VKEVSKHKTFILNGRVEMPICEDAAGKTMLPAIMLPDLGRHQIVSRIVFGKRLAYVLDLVRQKPRPETDSVFGLMVNDTPSREQKSKCFMSLQETTDLHCTMFEAGEIRVCHNHIGMASFKSPARYSFVGVVL